MQLSKTLKTALVRKEALATGFEDVGFAKADLLAEDAKHLRKWLDKGYHGDMSYMTNHFEKRTDPRLLVENARTVISLSYNYFTKETQKNKDAPIVSKYAFGRDYHKVLKKKLKNLLESVREPLGIKNARVFVDSAPVLERAWAAKAGLGWIGKNSMLIHPKKGSYFFLAELIVDVELDYDDPIKDHCGKCRRCIDACPTAAIHPEGYVMEGKKCISYATIEKKGQIPEAFRGKMENRVFGCDICIEVCPWNKFAKEHKEADFLPKRSLLEMSRQDWEKMNKEAYEKLFNGTPVRRAKYEGLKRNIQFLNK